MSGQKKEGTAPSTELLRILGDYCRILAEYNYLIGQIDTIQSIAIYDNYLPVERVLRLLGRDEAANVIEEKKFGRRKEEE